MTTSDGNGCVTFRFYRPEVSQVLVLGSFNGWHGDSLTMATAGDGWWSITAELPPGEYRFRYRADGEWFTDYAAYGVEQSKHGWNSVLIVPEYRPAMMRTRTNDELEQLRMAA